MPKQADIIIPQPAKLYHSKEDNGWERILGNGSSRQLSLMYKYNTNNLFGNVKTSVKP